MYVYYCRTYEKAVIGGWGGRKKEGHVLKDTTRRGLMPPHTIERCGGGGGRREVDEEERGARGGVDRRSDNTTSVDVEIDPHRLRLGRRQTDYGRGDTFIAVVYHYCLGLRSGFKFEPCSLRTVTYIAALRSP